NGNNITVVGDLVRRTLTANMNAKMEAPETRTWAFDPIVRVRANRGAYLAAVFTIARAYMASGYSRPKDTPNAAGFEEWSQFARFPLMWLGMADPVLSMKDARELDTKR